MYQASNKAGFEAALVAPVREVTIRVTALGSDFLELTDITDPTIEGRVYVDVERATRRTCQIRLINKDGAYTPKGSDFSSLGTNAIFFWDKMFKLEYGIKVDSTFEYVPLGLFMVDTPEVLAERGMSVINIDGSDLWKRMSFSNWAAPQAWAKLTAYNTVITNIATAAGIPSNRIILDALENRGTTEKQIQVPLYAEEGDNRGEKLKALCAEWGIDIYFDVNGFLRTRPLEEVAAELVSQSPDWTFSAGEDAIFLSVTKKTTGDTIKNHVVVTGEADDGSAVVRAEAINGVGTTTASKYYSNTLSPVGVAAIGDRVKAIRSKTLRTTAACLALAKTELLKSAVVEEDISLPSIVNPLFEGRDVIQIIETNSDTNDRYLLTRFDVPMRSSTQDIFVRKVRGI